MTRPTALPRQRHLQRLRWRLERDSFPRLQMLLLVLLTAGSGLLASFALLHAGLTHMGWRYAAAFLLAYGVFLGLLWLWLRTRAEDYTDFPDLSGFTSSDSSSGGLPACEGLGGNFGGGGASGRFDLPAKLSPTPLETLPDNGGEAIGQTLGAAAEGEELAIPLIVIILAAALVLSSAFIVYSAPSLFAELLLDGTLAATLYRRLHRLERRHWLETALRQTLLPFLLTGLLVTGCGAALHHFAPGAHTLGEAWQKARAPQDVTTDPTDTPR
jgi:hypothetical protein